MNNFIGYECKTKKNTTHYKKGHRFTILSQQRYNNGLFTALIVYPNKYAIRGTGVFLSNVDILRQSKSGWKSRIEESKAL